MPRARSAATTATRSLPPGKAAPRPPGRRKTKPSRAPRAAAASRSTKQRKPSRPKSRPGPAGGRPPRARRGSRGLRERAAGRSPAQRTGGVEIVLDQLPDAASLDLSRYSEATHRALYALTVAEYWTKAGETDEYELPSFSPEDAELTILFCRDRWFASWRDLAQPKSAPPEDRLPLLVIDQSPRERFGLCFSPL
jgi:hypothetical protein